MATTLEFWKCEDHVFVEFNLEKYTLADFLQLPQAKKIIDRMYDKIIVEYQSSVDLNKPKLEIVGDFIRKYFLEKDREMDVVILGNGDIVKFNVENPLPPEKP